MTFVTSYSGMSALQRKLGPFIVIKCGRRPFLLGVTRGAGRLIPASSELPGMRIFVTVFAPLAGFFELNLSLSRWCFVACGALHGAMAASKRKRGFAVIKSVDIRPGAGAVTGLAPKHRAVGSAPIHARPKFTAMRIVVARRARAIRKSKWKNSIPAATGSCFVAFPARHRGMSSG